MKKCFPVLQENVTVRKENGRERESFRERKKKKNLNYYLGIIRGRAFLLLLGCRMGNEGIGSIAFSSVTPLIPARCHTLLPKEAGSQGPLCPGQEGLAAFR